MQVVLSSWTRGGEHIGGIEYFNGIGLNYGDKIRRIVSIISENDWLGVPGVIQHSLILGVEFYRLGGGTVICHRNYGDPVSLLGTQTGEIDEGEVELDCLENHLSLNGDGKDSKELDAFNKAIFVVTGRTETFSATDLYNNLVETNLNQGPLNVMSYMWSTHETDSFFYRLDREDIGYDKPVDTGLSSDKPAEH